MIPVYLEWFNQNSQRNYPFADGATLQDAKGLAIPIDFLVDAIIHPLGLTGSVYLRSIDQTTRLIEWGDTGTNQPIGTTTWSDGETTGVVQDLKGRQIGSLVYGPGVVQLWTSSTRKFLPGATALDPAAFIPLNQSGVQGIILPDGSLMTGDITIQGTDGVQCTTMILGGQQILRVDVVGVAAPDLSGCETVGPPICTITAQRIPGSAFQLSQYDPYTLGLVLAGTSLDQICGASKARRQSSILSTDVCHPVTPGTPVPISDTGTTIVFPICDLEVNTFLMVAPSSPSYLNPVMITAVNKDPGAPGPELTSTGLQVGALPAGAVKLEIQGIGKGQLA